MKQFNEKEYDLFIIKIGLKIGYYRRLANMTQEQLSEYSGMSLNFISQLEGPGSYFCPSLKTLFIIAEVLGTTVSKLTDIDD